jgi:phosphatidylserine/phosphatidylglycerophosphate/cardiolipin synthase-like enzyme
MPDLFVPAPAKEEALAAEALPRFFPPVRLPFGPQSPLRVQPLLTPDNYADHVLPLIKSAKSKLYFQNQSIGFAKYNYATFNSLVAALREKIDEGLDVRIILRGDFTPRRMLEALKQRGFDQRRIKFQRNCHNKGIVVDSEAVLVSSHNWTNSGTQFNRDAGLIFFDRRVARYYEEVFLHDWDDLARHEVTDEVATPQLASEESAPPPEGMVRVPWHDYYEY